MATLTEQGILDAVVEVIEAHGPERFSMRSLSSHLGVSATAIYYYFDGKQALLDAAATHTTSQVVATSDPDSEWDAQIVQLLAGAAAEALRQPRTFGWLLSTYAKQPPLQVLDEAVLRLLAHGGLAPHAALHAKGALMRLLVGHITMLSSARPAATGLRAGHPSPAVAELPHLVEIETSGIEFDQTFVLETAIAGIVAAFR